MVSQNISTSINPGVCAIVHVYTLAVVRVFRGCRLPDTHATEWWVGAYLGRLDAVQDHLIQQVEGQLELPGCPRDAHQRSIQALIC